MTALKTETGTTMTKRLLLLRHAQSDLRYAGVDRQRPLTPKGMSEAVALGYYIRDNGLSPDYILCSDSRRTQETLEQIRECLHHDFSPEQMTFLPILYFGEVEDYLAELRCCDDVNTVLLIGHYPKIPVLVRMLVKSFSCEKERLQTLEKYEPATMTVLSCEIDKWKDLRYGESALIGVVNPNDYVCPLF